MSEKQERHRHILDLLSRNPIESQDELQDLLRAEGVHATQSTLSRDLREMGVVKGTGGYRVPDRKPTGANQLLALRRAIGSRLISVDRGGNLVVLRAAGNDEALEIAAAIERARLHQATAALPCNDAVLVIARTQAYAREIVRALRDRPKRALLRRLRN